MFDLCIGKVSFRILLLTLLLTLLLSNLISRSSQICRQNVATRQRSDCKSTVYIQLITFQLWLIMQSTEGFLGGHSSSGPYCCVSSLPDRVVADKMGISILPFLCLLILSNYIVQQGESQSDGEEI